ncbi:MAG: hypothetical protein ABL921_18600 [Pirellula sp.]
MLDKIEKSVELSNEAGKSRNNLTPCDNFLEIPQVATVDGREWLIDSIGLFSLDDRKPNGILMDSDIQTAHSMLRGLSPGDKEVGGRYLMQILEHRLPGFIPFGALVAAAAEIGFAINPKGSRNVSILVDRESLLRLIRDSDTSIDPDDDEERIDD